MPTTPGSTDVAVSPSLPMTAYLLAVSEAEAPTPQAQRTLLEARARFAETLQARGVLLDAERLRPSAEGRRVSSRGGQVTVAPGPFPGTLESYWTVEAPSLEAALAVARGLPLGPGEQVEVRPVMGGEHDPRKSELKGKVFAFGVLGAAPDEAAWVRLMDRLDEGTGDDFPAGFLCGVRLEAPRTGRRLVSRQGAPVVLDGPFPESKEVIGGLCFMRMASLEEAVAWAGTSLFARLGTLEVRELWRS